MSTVSGIAAAESTRSTLVRPVDGAKRSAAEAGQSDVGQASRRAVPMRDASDDEILGIDDGPRAAAADQSAFDWSVEPDAAADASVANTGEGAKPEAGAEANRLETILGANPELKQAWDDALAYRQSFRTPEDARTASAAVADLAKMDALFFSGRPQDHAELARVVASLDPAAFQSLAKVMADVARQGQGSISELRAEQDQTPAATPAANRVSAPERQNAATAEQEQFFEATNAAAVRAVIESIESQVERLLPEEISKGARNRLVGEIYRELDTSLRADRQFASQAREAFRSGALDQDHQKAIVSLVNNRARQAMPAVARRVLNEWTTAIVAANQDRRSRQRAAERRVDIAGSGRTGNDGVRPVTAKDINYSRMSDADILNM